jgi:23S rRNA G2445 N2-methylase RlmL
VKHEALSREMRPVIPMRGLDADAFVLDAARANAARAGLAEVVSFARGNLRDARPSVTNHPEGRSGGFLAANPP